MKAVPTDIIDSWEPTALRRTLTRCRRRPASRRRSRLWELAASNTVTGFDDRPGLLRHNSPAGFDTKSAPRTWFYGLHPIPARNQPGRLEALL